jgi:hypothetical protein
VFLGVRRDQRRSITAAAAAGIHTTDEGAIAAFQSFVEISRSAADIRGFKIIGTGAAGFTVDDFSYGAAVTAPVPEPAEWALLLGGAAAMAAWRRRRVH